MRFTTFLFLALSVAVPAFAAPPGSAQNFLDRANRLKAKGPLAFFDSDYGRLKAEATAVGKAIGDAKLQSDGKTDKAVGKIQNAVGGLNDAVRDAVKKP